MLDQCSSVCGQSHLQRDRVSSGVLPVRYAGWDLPVALILHRDLALRGVKDCDGRGAGPTHDPLVLEGGWCEGIALGNVHFDDPLLRPLSVALVGGSVFNE